MALIKGFKGLRYNTDIAGDIKTLVCPPYDIISPEQREDLVSRNPYNMVNLELPCGEDKYVSAANTLKEYIDKGILKRDEKDSIYIYEEEFTAYGEIKRIKGFISLVRLYEFAEKMVLPHEETLSKAKMDRFDLMSETFCNFSQVYSLYDDEEGKAESIINKASSGKPDIEFTDSEGIVQRLWVCDDEEIISAVKNQVEDKQFFIADGHHRYETALNFRKKLYEEGLGDKSENTDYVMMMLVSMQNEGLVVFPTHRILKGLRGYDKESTLSLLSENFDIEKKSGKDNMEKDLCVSDDKKVFAYYTGNNEYYLLTLKDNNLMKNAVSDRTDSYRDLDVAVLHTLILEPYFGIDPDNMAKGKNLIYTRDINEGCKGVDEGEFDCFFVLNPTKVVQIRNVALDNEKMPQKSTYFYPKIITGLVMNKII